MPDAGWKWFFLWYVQSLLRFSGMSSGMSVGMGFIAFFASLYIVVYWWVMGARCQIRYKS